MISLLTAAAVASASGGASTIKPYSAYEFRNVPPPYRQDGLEVTEFQMFDSADGVNFAPRGVASAPEYYGSYVPRMATDNDLSTFWTGQDGYSNTRTIPYRLVFAFPIPLHHVSIIPAGRVDFRFYSRLEIWATNTPNDSNSWVKIYKTEYLDTVGRFQFFPSNRKYYVSWTDGGNDYSSLVNVGLLDDKGINHAGTGADIGTWEASSMDGRIYGSEGTANINSGDPLDTAWSCRGGVGLLAHSCKDDFDCSMVDIKSKDGVHHSQSDAPAQTPLTITVSVSKDGGVSRTPLWTCGSRAQFAANETRRFYHPKFLSRIRFVFGAPINDTNGFCSLAALILNDKNGSPMSSKLVSIMASSRINRNQHEIYLNDGDPSTTWASPQGMGAGSFIDFGFLKEDLFDLGSITVQSFNNFPGQTPSSIRARLDTGAGFVDINGGFWSGYPAFAGNETRTFTVTPT